jgi:energy-coupling factor transport system ATP-binding protein
MALAKLERLTYWYPESARPALYEVEMALEAGLVLVAGASGSGKSSLLRCFNGLVPHFHGGRISGSGQVLGLPIPATSTRRLAREVGFVFQDPESQAVYGVVEREVAFALENVGLPRAEMRQCVELALHRLGLESLRNRRLVTLSGGERQRVALASALVLSQRLVVLDEPTSQLDAEGREALLDACQELVDSGCGVVLAEHRLEMLAPSAAGLVFVADGVVEGPAPMAGLSARLPRLPEWKPPGDAPGAVAWVLDGVSAGYGGVPVVERAGFSGRRGEVVVLRGPNGSGKTTLLRVIAGLLEPLAGLAERGDGRVAYLPQNPQDVLFRPTVRAEVELTIARTKGRPNGDSLLDRLGLKQLADRYPRDLSTGERQRAAIAAILAGGPALAVLDEPTRGMDVAARTALIDLISDLRSAATAVVLATHDADLAAAVADTVVVLAGGRAAVSARAQVAGPPRR